MAQPSYLPKEGSYRAVQFVPEQDCLNGSPNIIKASQNQVGGEMEQRAGRQPGWNSDTLRTTSRE